MNVIEVVLAEVNQRALNADLSQFSDYRGFATRPHKEGVLVAVNVADSADSDVLAAIEQTVAVHNPARLTLAQQEAKRKHDDLLDARNAYEPMAAIKDPTTIPDKQLREMVVWLMHEVMALRGG